MEVAGKKVYYYETKNGTCPYVEWRNSLDIRTQSILAARISRLKFGNLGHVSALGDGVHELKIDFGPGYRIYFGNIHGELVIILTGGSKRHQNSDITAAKTYWKDWKVRVDS